MDRTIILFKLFTVIIVTIESKVLEDTNPEGYMDEHCSVLLPNVTQDRNFVNPTSKRWPNGIVYYEMSSSFTSDQRDTINAALKEISDNSCVRFVQRTTQAGYVYIYTGASGCFAHLGYLGQGRHLLHLQQPNGGTCITKGIAVHEMLHILGFAHEHTRPDRKDFVNVDWSNVAAGTHVNFMRLAREFGEVEPVCTGPQSPPLGSNFDNCRRTASAKTFGVAYDFQSVMHYSPFAFANDRSRPTLTAKISGVSSMGNRVGMTALDIQKLNAAYSCPGTTRATTKATTRATTKATTPAPTTTPLPRTAPENDDCWKTCFKASDESADNFYLSQFKNLVTTLKTHFDTLGASGLAFSMDASATTTKYMQFQKQMIRLISMALKPDPVFNPTCLNQFHQTNTIFQQSAWSCKDKCQWDKTLSQLPTISRTQGNTNDKVREAIIASHQKCFQNANICAKANVNRNPRKRLMVILVNSRVASTAKYNGYKGSIAVIGIGKAVWNQLPLIASNRLLSFTLLGNGFNLNQAISALNKLVTCVSMECCGKN